MSTAGLPTIWELVAEGAATLPEPFSRAALINWVSARRPEVGVSSIAAHIPFATANATHTGHNPFADRAPLLHRVGRGQYLRYRRGGRRGGRRDAARRRRPLRPGGPHRLVGGDGGRARDPRARCSAATASPTPASAPVHSRLPWFVLSAKHGLLDPGEVVSPHEIQIDDQPAAYRTAWGEWVVAQLADRLQLDGVTVEVHGGVDFAQPLRQPLARRGAVLEIPLPGTWRDAGPDRRADGGPGSARCAPRSNGSAASSDGTVRPPDRPREGRV